MLTPLIQIIRVAMALLAPLVLLLATSPVQAGTQRFYGYATDLDSGRYLYTEIHEQELAGDRVQTSTITYFDPAGQQIARKTLDYRGNRSVPLFRSEIPGQGYVESIRGVGERIDLLKVTREKGEQIKALAMPKGLVAADSGFNHLLQDQLPLLLAGETLQFQFVVAGNLDSYKFRARKTGETSFEGAPAAVLRVEPDSLLRVLVDPLELLYDPATRRLLEYRGVSNMLDPATSKVYKRVRVAYSKQPPAAALAAGVTLPPLDLASR